jgi:hypothetical protein
MSNISSFSPIPQAYRSQEIEERLALLYTRLDSVQESLNETHPDRFLPVYVHMLEEMARAYATLAMAISKTTKR